MIPQFSANFQTRNLYFLYYIVHYEYNQCTKCTFIIQKTCTKEGKKKKKNTEEGFLLEEPENRSSQLRGFTVSKEITFRILHEYGTTRRRIVQTVPSGSVSGLPPCPYVSERRTACSQRNDTNCIVREEKLFRELESLLQEESSSYNLRDTELNECEVYVCVCVCVRVWIRVFSSIYYCMR